MARCDIPNEKFHYFPEPFKSNLRRSEIMVEPWKGDAVKIVSHDDPNLIGLIVPAVYGVVSGRLIILLGTGSEYFFHYADLFHVRCEDADPFNLIEEEEE